MQAFDSVVHAKPDQEMQLKQDDSASIDYPLIASKFSNVSKLILHFPENFGAEQTRILYIGLRGEFQQNFRDKVKSINFFKKFFWQIHFLRKKKIKI